MSEKNILLIALSSGFRFLSVKGQVTTEDLFNIPLTSATGFSLDMIAKGVNQTLKALGEESFVAQGDNAERTRLQNMLDTVKFVIDYKQTANAAAAEKLAKRAERTRLLEALENRKDADLASMSEDEIRKKLEELD